MTLEDAETRTLFSGLSDRILPFARKGDCYTFCRCGGTVIALMDQIEVRRAVRAICPNDHQ